MCDNILKKKRKIRKMKKKKKNEREFELRRERERENLASVGGVASEMAFRRWSPLGTSQE